MNAFSLLNLGAILAKEFIQMRRDRVTFAMMIGIPLLQLTLFGYAINSDPKHLPTALRPMFSTLLTPSADFAANIRTISSTSLSAPISSWRSPPGRITKGFWILAISLSPAGPAFAWKLCAW